jgi:hypothetical protein
MYLQTTPSSPRSNLIHYFSPALCYTKMGGIIGACIERRHGKPESSSSATAVELVLGNDDLLREVLLRLSLPTALVRAACVCKRWLRIASSPAFLHDFRVLHPPPLLGSFPNDPTWRPKLLARRGPDAELTDMARRTNAYLSSISQDERGRYEVLDVRNGRVLFYVTDVSDPIRLGTMVCSPLMQRSPPAYLPFEWLGTSSGGVVADDPDAVEHINTFEFLPEDGGDGLSYFEVILANRLRGRGNPNAVFATVVACEAGIAGERRATPPLVLPKRLRRSSCSKRGLLCGGGKFYVVSKNGYVLGLDLAAVSLFRIRLPDELLLQDGTSTTEAVEHDDDYLRNVCLSRGESSKFYVVCIKELKVFVWLLRDAERGSNANDWVLLHAICLLQVFAPAVVAEHDLSSGGCRVHLLEQSGDRADFVYLSVLDMSTTAEGCSRTCYYLFHVKRRAVEKVLEVEEEEAASHSRTTYYLLNPFTMVWPPAFPPALNDGYAWS